MFDAPGVVLGELLHDLYVTVIFGYDLSDNLRRISWIFLPVWSIACEHGDIGDTVPRR